MVERIEALCKEKGVSFRKVEMSLGFSNGILRSWEKKTPSADKLAAVAAYFGVSMEYLLTGKEKQPTDPDGLSDKNRRIIDWFRSLPQEKQEAILIAQDGPIDAV